MRLCSFVFVWIVVVMLLKCLGKGLDYREIGDKFGVGVFIVCIKVNEVMKFLVSFKMYIISKI